MLIATQPLIAAFPVSALLPDIDLRAALTLIHCLYWLMIVNASALRRSKMRRNQALADTASSAPIATKTEVTSKGSPALFMTGATYSLFYLFLMLWWTNPNWVGPFVFQPNIVTQVAGLTILVTALIVKVWSFWVFRTWRLFPQITPGHQLVTSGPYGVVRHPLYFAFQLLFFGSFLLIPRWAFLAQVVINFFAHDFRCRVEEDILVKSFGETYQEYKQNTQRLLPWVY
jgi:protein-S-isoprenylcysteine O-methyltransferase Ste14